MKALQRYHEPDNWVGGTLKRTWAHMAREEGSFFVLQLFLVEGGQRVAELGCADA